MNENNKELVHKLARLDGLMRRCFAHAGHGGAHNPHRGQGRVLSILKLQPTMTQRELSYLLDMRKQSLGELLAKLEARGLITRTPSEEDRRAMVIQLTEEGKKAAEKLEEEHEEGGDLFAALSEEEQAQLDGYLDRLIAAMEEKVGDGEDERAAHFHGHPHDAHFGRGFGPGPHGPRGADGPHGERCGHRHGMGHGHGGGRGRGCGCHHGQKPSAEE